MRELENTLRRASVLATTDVLLPKDIPLGGFVERATTATSPQNAADPPELAAAETGNKALRGMGSGESSQEKVDAAINLLFSVASRDKSLQLLPWMEREFTIAAMKVTGGNQLKAAQLLGITRATLRKRVERFSITRDIQVR